jgi:hypothetical protein
MQRRTSDSIDMQPHQRHAERVVASASCWLLWLCPTPGTCPEGCCARRQTHAPWWLHRDELCCAWAVAAHCAPGSATQRVQIECYR